MRAAVRYVALLVLLGCQSEANDDDWLEIPEAEGTPNVIVVLVDTLRADRLGAYGNPRPTSPFFDAFARREFRFRRAYAPSPWTRPSVASLFTGTYPQHHGVQMRQDALPADLPTMAELLRQRGLQTVIVNTNPHVTEAWNMTRGFEEVVHVMPHPDMFKAGNGANVVMREVRRMLHNLREPFFLYVHLIDPHWPFEPPAQDMEAIGYNPATTSWSKNYDGEIRFTDRHIEHMFEFMDRAGFLDDAVVAITADHGDEFLDHGSTGHGKTLYQEVVHVPLAIGLPMHWRATTLGDTTCPIVEQNVSIIDLLPTLLELVDVARPPALDGQSLLPLMRCEDLDDTRPLYFSVEKERASLGAVMVANAKLIKNRATGEKRLYLLDEDPSERPVHIASRPGLREFRDYMAGLLESYETSVRPGLHLELAGKDGDASRERVELELKTPGRFSKVHTEGFEKSDRYKLVRGGKVMKVTVKLSAHWHRSPKHVWVQDRDELSFQVDPPSAPVSLSVMIDGNWAPRAAIRAPAAPLPAAWPMQFTREQLLVQEGRDLVDRRHPGIYLYEQRQVQTEKVDEISAELTSALQALGYIQ